MNSISGLDFLTFFSVHYHFFARSTAFSRRFSLSLETRPEQEMEDIKQLIYDGKTDEAIRALDAVIEANPRSDEAFYLRGNAYRKKGEWQQAMNNYLSATEINPDSPAQKAYEMVAQILDFTSPTLFNF